MKDLNTVLGMNVMNNDVIEWAELTESYDKASAVYREIEKLESMLNSL